MLKDDRYFIDVFHLSEADALLESLEMICDRSADAMSMSGGSITLTTQRDGNGASAASKSLTVMADLQFTIGEGPEIEALTTKDVVVVPNVAETAIRWLAFASVARDEDISSVIALPLRAGSVNLGVLTLYSSKQRSFDEDSICIGLKIAKAVTAVLLIQQEVLDGRSSYATSPAADSYRAVVHQATGMISAQLECSVDDALVRLRAHAYANHLSINEVASAVINRELRLNRE